jgi:hypothetical protein
LETRLRNRLPPPTSLKQLEDVQEEWYKIKLETVQSLYEVIPEGLRLYWRQKSIQHHINEEMYTVSVVFPLLCPTPVDVQNRQYSMEWREI